MFCRYCGSPNADDARFCESCGKSLKIESPAAEKPDEATEETPSAAAPEQPPEPVPPAAPVPPPAPAPPPVAAPEQPATPVQPPAPVPEGLLVAGQRVAGMGDRLIAVILDTILVGAFFAVFGMWFSVGRQGMTESGFSLSGAPALIVMLVCVCAAFLYYWLLEGWTGATLGKAIAGVRVLNRDGSRCSLKGSLIRNLLRFVDGIAVYLVGFLVAILSKLRQRVGDHVAGTVVVEHRPHKAVRVTAVLVWLALIAGGIAGAVLIHGRASRAAPSAAEVAAPATAAEAPSSTAAAETPSTAEAAPAAGAEASAGGALANLRVSSTGDMKITHFNFLEKKGGPARPYAPYAPGDTVYIEYKVGEFARDSDSRMKLDLEAVTNDPEGAPIHKPWTRTMSQNSDGSPLNGSYSVTIPVFAQTGPYEFRLNANDQTGGTRLELSAKLMVEGPPIAPARVLEIRDFALSRARGGEAADPPVLQGGGTVYMRCKLFGVQLLDDVADIQMAFQVVGPDGKVLLDKPDFFRDRDTYVYHPPAFYLPITGHLSVPGGAAKGTYTLQYTARDNLAGKEVVKKRTVDVR